jgi:hypothetical protein
MRLSVLLGHNFCITRLRVRFIKIILFGCTGIVEGIIVRNQLICVSDGAPQRPISGTINVLAAIVPLEFVLHDDSSLPSIPEQLQRFANASIIIGPHGAGMVNIIASKRRTI